MTGATENVHRFGWKCAVYLSYVVFCFVFCSGDGPLSAHDSDGGASSGLSVSTDVELQLLEAAKSGDVNLVRTLVSDHHSIVNCRDVDGRHSTPLHFAAGYNRLAVVEFLLQSNADVHAKDKGGLVPLHNACSYGHAKARTLGSVFQYLPVFSSWCRNHFLFLEYLKYATTHFWKIVVHNVA